VIRSSQREVESIAPLEDHLEIVQLSVARARATEKAGAAIARQLNGPLTALLLYMNEIKQHSHQLSQAPGNRVYLQQVVENAVQQTERVCAMVKQMSDTHPEPDPDCKLGRDSLACRSRDGRKRVIALGSSGMMVMVHAAGTLDLFSTIDRTCPVIADLAERTVAVLPLNWAIRKRRTSF
jgi:hypothetical protein